MRRDDWETPQKLFDFLNDKFDFQLDAAASKANSKCVNFLSEKENALTVAWYLKKGSIFCNPPYSLAKEFAMHAAGQYSIYQTPTCMLLPVRADRLWFNYVKNSVNVKSCWITGRLHFSKSEYGAFMYNVIFYWHPKVILPPYMQAGQFNDNGKGDAKS